MPRERERKGEIIEGNKKKEKRGRGKERESKEAGRKEKKEEKKSFPLRELNPGLLGENQKS